MGAGVAKSIMTGGAVLGRPENVYFAGRFNVKEKCTRTAHGLAHGAVAVRDASVLGVAGASAAPASGMLSGASILAMDGFQAGKANQMLVGMVNFSNMPETAQFVANNHNIALVGFGLVGAALAWVTQYPVGFLNRRANVEASKQPQTPPASKTAALPETAPAVVSSVAVVAPAAKEAPAAIQPAVQPPAIQPPVQPVLQAPVIPVERRPVPLDRIEADLPPVQPLPQVEVPPVQPSAPSPSLSEAAPIAPSSSAPAETVLVAKPAKRSWFNLKGFSFFNRKPKAGGAESPKADTTAVKVPAAESQPAVVSGEVKSAESQPVGAVSPAPHAVDAPVVAPEKGPSEAP